MKTRGTPERPTRSSQRNRLAGIPTQEKKKKKKVATSKAAKAVTSSSKAAKASTKLKPPPKAAPKAAPKPPKPPKPTKEQVEAAKAAIAATEAQKGEPEEANPVEVKQESGKRRFFTEEEDVAACRAYVNVTLAPTVGAQQKGETFWMKVHESSTMAQLK